MGTPEFAVPSLAQLAEHHHVVAAVSQPDRPAGRGRKLTAPPVKRKAEELGLPILQPHRIVDDELYERLAHSRPDAIAVVGYGQMIPKRIRELPSLGCVNVHSSLLPKYRGAAPVNWAIARGETRTGVTTMRIAKAMDAGDIFLSRETAIHPDETASALNRRLAPIGADLLLETLSGLEAGTLHPVPQNHAEATRAPLLKRRDGRIDWSLPARTIHNRLRGFDPWPGVFTRFRGQRLRIFSATVAEGAEGVPGQVQISARGLVVGCGRGCLVLHEVQMAGRKRVAALDFARGARLESGAVFGDE